MNAVTLFFFILTVICLLVVFAHRLTVAATITAAILATIIFFGTGFSGIWLLGAFFAMGVVASNWKKKWKQAQLLIKITDSRRTTGQVIANGGVSAFLGLISIINPGLINVATLLIACSFSAASADTVSSELGMVYAKNPINIITFKKGLRGDDGVISMEGTLLGIAASCVIAVIYSLLTRWNITACCIIIVSGIAGNIADSILGALLEKRGMISNNTVNFLNTIMGAFVGYCCWYLSC